MATGDHCRQRKWVLFRMILNELKQIHIHWLLFCLFTCIVLKKKDWSMNEMIWVFFCRGRIHIHSKGCSTPWEFRNCKFCCDEKWFTSVIYLYVVSRDSDTWEKKHEMKIKQEPNKCDIYTHVYIIQSYISSFITLNLVWLESERERCHVDQMYIRYCGNGT